MGAYAIENHITANYGVMLADIDVAYDPGDYFGDTSQGDMCIRSFIGPIRLGSVANTGNSSVIVDTAGGMTIANGSLTVNGNGSITGALYIVPHGDLLMGSFTNSPSH